MLYQSHLTVHVSHPTEGHPPPVRDSASVTFTALRHPHLLRLRVCASAQPLHSTQHTLTKSFTLPTTRAGHPLYQPIDSATLALHVAAIVLLIFPLTTMKGPYD